MSERLEKIRLKATHTKDIGVSAGGKYSSTRLVTIPAADFSYLMKMAYKGENKDDSSSS